MKSECIVVILTFNSAGIIRETVTQALKVSSSVFVVDSGSTDGTLQVLSGLACEVVHRDFSNYSDQRNWAIERCNSVATWQLHLDADEVLDEQAIKSIRAAIASPDHDSYLIKRRDYFMGKMLSHSGLNPWHLRLFRSGHGECEHRMYDQHFISATSSGRLSGYMHDKNDLSLSTWIVRHNRWSDLEAEESMRDGNDAGTLKADLFGDARERTRFLKSIYYRLPGLFRAVLYFVYRYFFRLGFLDGFHGFYFAFFQAFWFRMLVDAKIWELNQSRTDKKVFDSKE